MKYLIVMIVMAYSSLALCGEKKIEVPPYLKGAKVTVTLANGEKHSYSSEEWAVVPRLQQVDDKAFIIVRKDSIRPYRPNTFKAYGGAGPSGMKASLSGADLTVEQKYGLNYGLGYERDLSDRFSLDVLGIGNSDGLQSGLLGLGYKF